MDLKKIATSVAPFASTLASVLLPGSGPIAVAAAAAVKGIFGDKDGSDLSEAIANATPEQMLALKKLEQDYQLSLLQAGYSDVASARNMAVQNHDSTPKILTYIILGVFVGLYVYLRFVTDPHQLDLLKDGVNTMRDAVIMVVSFYFGAMHRDNK